MEQPSNVRPISADLSDRMGQEVERRQNFPTAQLERMIADAHQMIAVLAEKGELIKAAHVITVDKLEEAFKAADDADKAEIDDLRRRIDALNEQRRTRSGATNAKQTKAQADVEEQLAAIDRMRSAQQAVLATLAKDVTPTPLADVAIAAKRKPKAA
jgi:hypothetical protein